MKTKAAVLFEANTKLEICKVDLEKPQAGEVCVEIKAAGVCHTDYSVMKGQLNAPLPAILGHEGAGVVVEVGDGVSDVQVGDHVKKGDALCIIEAMKVMNEIQADFAGEIIDILEEDGSSVEYGQPLFKIRKN